MAEKAEAEAMKATWCLLVMNQDPGGGNWSAGSSVAGVKEKL